jgi:MFS family permease
VDEWLDFDRILLIAYSYNALTYTYLVELWPFAERSRGIAYFQLWGRLAGFFTTFINPIALENIKWRWLVFYCCWLGFECVFVYFLFPETYGRTLEELAFSESTVSDIAAKTNTFQFSRTRKNLTELSLRLRKPEPVLMRTRSVPRLWLRIFQTESEHAILPNAVSCSPIKRRSPRRNLKVWPYILQMLPRSSSNLYLS